MATAIEHTGLRLLQQTLRDTENWIVEGERGQQEGAERLLRLVERRRNLKARIRDMARAIGEPVPDEAL